MRSAVHGALVVVVVLGLSACGGDDENSSTSEGTTTTTTADAAPGTSSTTSTIAETTTTTASANSIQVRFAGGQVEGGIQRVAVKLGDDVTITAVSDVAEELHVHTYDARIDLGP